MTAISFYFTNNEEPISQVGNPRVEFSAFDFEKAEVVKRQEESFINDCDSTVSIDSDTTMSSIASSESESSLPILPTQTQTLLSGWESTIARKPGVENLQSLVEQHTSIKSTTRPFQ